MAPRGVGFPALPLPRIAIILLLVVIVVYIIVNGWRFKLEAKHTYAMCIISIFGYFLSAAISAENLRGIAWVFQFAVAYIGAGMAFLLVAADPGISTRIYRGLRLIAISLAIWSVFEYVTQTKVFFSRNLYDMAGAAYSINIRRLTLDGSATLFSSLGPFANNLPFAGVLCALGGVVVVGAQNRLFSLFPGSALLVFSIMATQSRAGVAALFLMVVTMVFLLKTYSQKFLVICGALFGVLVFLFVHGPEIALVSIFGDNVRPLAGLYAAAVVLSLSWGGGS
ncbi:hypothetical protein ACFL2V_01300, partial [Pseudomonadota bacterium]